MEFNPFILIGQKILIDIYLVRLACSLFYGLDFEEDIFLLVSVFRFLKRIGELLLTVSIL